MSYPFSNKTNKRMTVAPSQRGMKELICVKCLVHSKLVNLGDYYLKGSRRRPGASGSCIALAACLSYSEAQSSVSKSLCCGYTVLPAFLDLPSTMSAKSHLGSEWSCPYSTNTSTRMLCALGSSFAREESPPIYFLFPPPFF